MYLFTDLLANKMISVLFLRKNDQHDCSFKMQSL